MEKVISIFLWNKTSLLHGSRRANYVACVIFADGYPHNKKWNFTNDCKDIKFLTFSPETNVYLMSEAYHLAPWVICKSISFNVGSHKINVPKTWRVLSSQIYHCIFPAKSVENLVINNQICLLWQWRNSTDHKPSFSFPSVLPYQHNVCEFHYHIDMPSNISVVTTVRDKVSTY